MEVSYSIRHKRNVVCRVRLPVSDCVTELQQTLAEAPHLKPEFAPIVEKLQSVGESGSCGDLDTLQEHDLTVEGRLSYVAAGVLEKGEGFAWCPTCGHEFPGSGTVFERYERGRWAMEGGGGRRFYCGRSLHLLFEVVDWRS